MSTAQAILKLREKLSLNQKELANRMGVGARSIARYEGGYEPSSKVLKKLADLAESENVDYLRDIFEAKMRGDMISQLERLPSAGAARRVTLHDLEHWASWQNQIATGARIVRERVEEGSVKLQGVPELLSEIQGTARRVQNEIQLYINPQKRVSWDDLSPQTRAYIQANPAPKNLSEKLKAINQGNAEFWDREQTEAPRKKGKSKDAKKAY